MPAALVPRPWDFVDPPIGVKAGRSMTPGPVVQETLAAAMAPSGPAPQASEAEKLKGAGAFNTEVRDGEASSVRESEKERDEDGQEVNTGTETEGATAQIVDAPATVPRHDVDLDSKDS